MKFKRYEGGDLGSSFATTPGTGSMREKFMVEMWIQNAVKDGIPMMFWTCLSIHADGRFFIDLRDLPGVDMARVASHSRVGTQPHEQRDIALALIDAAFANLGSLSAWCHTHGQQVCDWNPGMKDVTYPPKPEVTW